jgi:hypothetical protein
MNSLEGFFAIQRMCVSWVCGVIHWQLLPLRAPFYSQELFCWHIYR